MRKNIRKVVDKYYDVYKPDDYVPGADNLNPVREVNFDIKYEEILSAIQGKIEKQYKIAGIEYPDEEVPLTSEGLSNNIDTLLNAFRKPRDPFIKLAEDHIPMPFLLDPNSMAPEDLSNHLLTIDCNGITTIDDLTSDGEEGSRLNGQPCNIRYHVKVLEEEVLKDYTFESIHFTNNENPSGALQGDIIALYTPLMEAGASHHFYDWFLDENCELSAGKKIKVQGKLESDGVIYFDIYAKFIGENPEDITDPVTIEYYSCSDPLDDANKDSKNDSGYYDIGAGWINPNDVKYTRGGKKLEPLQGTSQIGKYFRGWYSDPFAGSDKLTKLEDVDILYGSGKKYIRVFAKFTLTSEEDEEELDPQDEEIKKGAFNIDGCDFVELHFLKIILMIVKIVKILVDIVSTVLGVVIPITNIVKEAQLAWINPPFMTSLVNQVTQKLMSVMFSLIGVLLMKVWSMLSFECVSENSLSTLSQISSVMAGIDDSIAGINSIALIADDIGKAWSGKDELSKKIEELKKSQEESKSIFENLGEDIQNAILEPFGADSSGGFDPTVLYSNMVPSEIRTQLSKAIANVKSSQKSFDSLVNTWNNMFNKEEVSNETEGTLTSLEP